MTTTARTLTSQIATDSLLIADLVILGLEFLACDLCPLPAAELFSRIDNRDDSDVLVCEHCADRADVRFDA
jgi:hypothetical protein